MVIERYSHVMHIVSNVEGTLKPGLTSMDVLRAAEMVQQGLDEEP
jgi:anthranilate synthase component 1